MGRGRKPVEMQKGNITNIDAERKKQEEKSVTTGKDQLKTAPKWLINPEARNEWRRITKELKEIEVVGNLDKNNLGAYCNAFANYLNATEKLKDEDFLIERKTRTGTIIVRNPLIDVQRIYAEEMRKFASLCGMTIDARLKAAVIKTNAAEEILEEKFGAI